MNTKDKGAKGEAFVISDLTKKGYRLALPFGENLPFDVVAIGPDYKPIKIQVKYRVPTKGVVEFEPLSVWGDFGITKVAEVPEGAVDFYAVVLPDGRVAYITADEVGKKRFTLRTEETKNRQKKNVKLFESYMQGLGEVAFPARQVKRSFRRGPSLNG